MCGSFELLSTPVPVLLSLFEIEPKGRPLWELWRSPVGCLRLKQPVALCSLEKQGEPLESC